MAGRSVATAPKCGPPSRTVPQRRLGTAGLSAQTEPTGGGAGVVRASDGARNSGKVSLAGGWRMLRRRVHLSQQGWCCTSPSGAGRSVRVPFAAVGERGSEDKDEGEDEGGGKGKGAARRGRAACSAVDTARRVGRWQECVAGYSAIVTDCQRMPHAASHAEARAGHWLPLPAINL